MDSDVLQPPGPMACIVMAALVAAAVLLLGRLFTANRKPVPSGWQNFGEFAIDGLRTLYMGLLGPKGAVHVPLVITLFFFILISNLLSLTPLRSPTSNLSTNLGLALCVFFYVQYWAIKSKGLGGYLKHFGGPEIIPLIPLFILTETVGIFAQPLSLAMRLYGNIYGEDVINDVVVKASPTLLRLGEYHLQIPFQLPVYALQTFTGVLQAFIFTLLTSAYIGIALHTDHAHDEEHPETLPDKVEDAAYIPSF